MQNSRHDFLWRLVFCLHNINQILKSLPAVKANNPLCIRQAFLFVRRGIKPDCNYLLRTTTSLLAARLLNRSVNARKRQMPVFAGTYRKKHYKPARAGGVFAIWARHFCAFFSLGKNIKFLIIFFQK